jgi:hypothetical protein
MGVQRRLRVLGLVLGVLGVVSSATPGHAAEAIRFDFEGEAADGWLVVAGDLGRFQCTRPVWYNGEAFGKSGQGFLSTIETPAGPWDDGLTGIAESPVFIPSAPDLSFLIGGGDKASVGVALCREDGTELARATGHNSHLMRRVDWHVPDAVGHPVFLRLVDQDKTGNGWLIVDDFRAEGRLDPDATRARFAGVLRKARWQTMVHLRAQINLEALRRQITDLAATFGPRYVPGAAFLERLEQHARELAGIERNWGQDASDAKIAAAAAGLEALVAFQREVAVANPLLGGQPLLYVVRQQYIRDHHNTETLFHTGEPNCGSYTPGGALKVLDLRSGTSTVLVDPGPEGVVRDPEVSFAGTTILFSMRRARNENYHLYEVNADGSGLRQLTSEPEATDIDPLYLPDDSIAFSSTREPKYCHCNMHIMANLHRMDADGANIQQIGKSTLFEGHSSLLPDGRILYYRWEYVDRNFGDAQGLWTMNPDGTNPAVFWGNNTASPGAVFDPRPIPGTASVACIFGACHDRPWGALAIVDRRLGVDADRQDTAPVTQIWPASARGLIGVGDWDTFWQATPRYEDPWPLAETGTGIGAGKYFLVSRATGKGSLDAQQNGTLEMGIYLVDIFGNEICLHTEAPACFDPQPLGPRPRPPVIPTRRNVTEPSGRFYVQNVYAGTHLLGVKPGDVASLRVVESREKRFWTGPLWQCAQFKNGDAQSQTLNRPAISWAGFEVKQILGTVPVEPDGSVYVEVPAERFVYFQLLDRDGMLISTMRSGTLVQPGETTGCVGCHESRLTAPPRGAAPTSLALQQPARELQGWYGPSRPFSYTKEVQPVWDKHCVRCHDFGKDAGKQGVLAGDKELVFNASYVELLQHWGDAAALVNTVGLGQAPINPAYAVGSHRSRLVELLRRGHQEVTLSPEEMDRVITWIDLGAPYYPDYACAHPDNVAGRSALTLAQATRLGELTGLQFFGDPQGSPVYYSHRLWTSFARPELSPCLQKLDSGSDAYREALAILRQGQAELQSNPEADMPGFRYCAEHQTRDLKYERLRERERGRREALADGRRLYDPGISANGVPRQSN